MGCDYVERTPIVALRFDDNYVQTHTILAPIMRKYGVPGTIPFCNGFTAEGAASTPEKYGSYAQLNARRGEGWELCQHDIADDWGTNTYKGAGALGAWLDADLALTRAGLGDSSYNPRVAVPPAHRFSRLNLPAIMSRFDFMTSPRVGTNSDWGIASALNFEALFRNIGECEMLINHQRQHRQYRIFGYGASLDDYATPGDHLKLAVAIAAKRRCIQVLNHTDATNSPQLLDERVLVDFENMLIYLLQWGTRFVTLSEFCKYYTNLNNPHARGVLTYENGARVYNHRLLIHPDIFNHLYNGALPGDPTGFTGQPSWGNTTNASINPAGITAPVAGYNVMKATRGQLNAPYLIIMGTKPQRMLKLSFYVLNGTGAGRISWFGERYEPAIANRNILDGGTHVAVNNASWKRCVLWLTPKPIANGVRIYFTAATDATCHYCAPKLEEVNPFYEVGDTDAAGDVVGTNVV